MISVLWITKTVHSQQHRSKNIGIYMFIEIIYSIAAYIIGSVNFSIIISKLFRKQDPRDYGSKNAGVTNVYRQSGILLASITLLLDISRAASIGLAAKHMISDQYIELVSLGLILGNRFPCFHNFIGGKGVANYLGITIAISPYASIAGIVVWKLTFFISRIPFLASLLMVFVLCVGRILTKSNNFLTILETVSVAILIISFHKHNISRFVKPN